ncbi:hypothetical protein GBZ26_01610 [Azospirillum formosense]|uniref:Uncharacterized protein n=1 Tax=Azospirillum formosense TaxID=861533 RepID=A0ABX2KYE5_9PROT|nr:hypothetical protein [Azospirillum formosense]MBY3754526.1 hypothetical protein [Azospirillum formosense]NUB17925.1 hypothetical protein [Azospirillum formosense]
MSDIKPDLKPTAPRPVDGAAPASATPASTKVIDFRRYRLARLINDASVQQGELARMMRVSANERTQLAEALQGAQRHLATIADSYTHLLTRLAREKDFRTACQEAAELDDLDEMIRRRDALASELADIRRGTRSGLRLGLTAGRGPLG